MVDVLQTKSIRSYTVHFIPATEGGYTVEVPTLPGCVTEGETFEEARRNVEEAIQLYLESLQARGIELPDDTKTVVGQVAVAIA